MQEERSTSGRDEGGEGVRVSVRVSVRVRAGAGKGVEVEVSIPERSTYEDLLAHLKLNPVEVIVLCNGRVVPEDEQVDSDAEIEVIRIVSGG